MNKQPNKGSGSGGDRRPTHKKRRPREAIIRGAKQSPVQGNRGPQQRVVGRGPLENTARRLEIALALAIVCDLALKAQNVERDHEVALAMRWSIIDPLNRQIETLNQITHRQPETDGNHPVRQVAAALDADTNPQTLRVSRSDLDTLCLHLGLVVNFARVCSAALEAQHAEADVEIATTLRHSFIDILQEEIERIRVLVGRTGG